MTISKYKQNLYQLINDTYQMSQCPHTVTANSEYPVLDTIPILNDIYKTLVIDNQVSNLLVNDLLTSSNAVLLEANEGTLVSDSNIITSIEYVASSQPSVVTALILLLLIKIAFITVNVIENRISSLEFSGEIANEDTATSSAAISEIIPIIIDTNITTLTFGHIIQAMPSISDTVDEQLGGVTDVTTVDSSPESILVYNEYLSQNTLLAIKNGESLMSMFVQSNPFKKLMYLSEWSFKMTQTDYARDARNRDSENGVINIKYYPLVQAIDPKESSTYNFIAGDATKVGQYFSRSRALPYTVNYV